jgi:YD repeat-containing protein
VRVIPGTDCLNAVSIPAAKLPTATFAPANPTLVVTYNGDGSVASTTEDCVLTTFGYNTDGTVATQTRAGVTKTFSYNASGNVTGAI